MANVEEEEKKKKSVECGDCTSLCGESLKFGCRVSSEQKCV